MSAAARVTRPCRECEGRGHLRHMPPTYLCIACGGSGLLGAIPPREAEGGAVSAPASGRPAPRLALELFSGTATVAAALRGRGWRVVTVDLDPTHRPDVVADVSALPLRLPPGAVDFIWASPPCTEFSDADPRKDHRTKQPSVDLVAAVLRTVAELRPRYWILENVRGAIPFLGVPAQKVGPFCLWGYFPPIPATFGAQTHRKTESRSAGARASVPAELAEAVADSVGAYLDAGCPPLLDLRPFRRHRHRAARPSPEQRGFL